MLHSNAFPTNVCLLPGAAERAVPQLDQPLNCPISLRLLQPHALLLSAAQLWSAVRQPVEDAFCPPPHLTGNPCPTCILLHLQRGYGVLCVSQFTLFGRLKGAGKPDYSKAMPPQQASSVLHAMRHSAALASSRRLATCKMRKASAVPGIAKSMLTSGAAACQQTDASWHLLAPRLPTTSLQAREAYAAFLDRLRQQYDPDRIQDGVFGAMMQAGGWLQLTCLLMACT